MNVLIYLYKKNLAPIGGHHGYNYNLNCQLEKMGVTNIHFLETDKGNLEAYKNGLKDIPYRWLRNMLTVMKNLIRKGQLLFGHSHFAVVDLNQYDIVHFQSTYWMFACRDSLKDYKGKVVLTSHSPTLLSREIIDSELTGFEKKYMMWYYKRLIKMDEYAFNRADYIVFPCPEAEEPYYHAWHKFAEIKKNNEQKFKYMLSGIEPSKAKLSRVDIRKKYDIPENAFVLCYVGRHNEIKGYDILKKIGEKVLATPNTYILVAGREEPLTRYSHERWIEIGWTNDPHSLISASDAFVLPNRETYFDLVMLEVLSLGSIVIASATGGNKFFNRLKPNGVFLYNDFDECLGIIGRLQSMSKQEKNNLKTLNRKLYEDNFTSEIFAKNYMQLINSL